MLGARKISRLERLTELAQHIVGSAAGGARLLTGTTVVMVMVRMSLDRLLDARVGLLRAGQITRLERLSQCAELLGEGALAALRSSRKALCER